jgi:hypothetical protein
VVLAVAVTKVAVGMPRLGDVCPGQGV